MQINFDFLKKNIVLIGGVTLAVAAIIGIAAYVQISNANKEAKTRLAGAVAVAKKNIASTPLPAAQLTQTYAEPGMGYAIMFPADWVIGKTDQGTKSVVLTGKEGSPAYGATIVIQNLLTKKTDGVYADAAAASEDLRSQLMTQTTNANVSQDAPITYTTSKNETVQGTQWFGEFNVNETPFKQLQIVLTHPNGMYLHSIAYAAPATTYAVNEATAKAIIASFVMTEEAYSATSTQVQAASQAKKQ